MPQESIGVCGYQSERRDWNIAELEIGICYITKACGDPPDGFEVGIVWHEHELGDYPTIGLIWNGPNGTPWEYISRAERALDRLNDAVDWSALDPERDSEDQAEDEEEGLETEDEASDEGSVLQSSLFEADRIHFVPANQLPFDVAQTVQLAIADWEARKPLGFTRPMDESSGDFIVAEMESMNLRWLNGDTACFNAEADPDEFRKCVFSALDRWLVKAEISTRRSPEEMEEYRRPCGE